MRVAVLVNYLHLLDYCRLSGLAGACWRDIVSMCKRMYGKCDARRQTGSSRKGWTACQNEEGRVRCWARVVRPMNTNEYVGSRDVRIGMTATRSVDIRHGMGGNIPPNKDFPFPPRPLSL